MTLYDRDIRRLLLAGLRGASPSLFIREEHGVSWQVVADIVTIGDRFECFEIKSDHDNLDRITPPKGSQVVHYSKVFDRVTVVAATRHIENVIARVPSWWGIYEAQPDSIRRVRESTDNPSLDWMSVAMMLHRTEAIKLAKVSGSPSYGGKHSICAGLVAALSPSALRVAVRAALRSRDYLRESRKALLPR